MGKSKETKSFPQLIKDGLLNGKPRGDDVGRQLKHLRDLTSPKVLVEFFKVQMALRLIFRVLDLSDPLQLFGHLMAAYVIIRCLGGRRILRWFAKSDATMALETFVEAACCINPFCDVDRNCLWVTVALLRLHPVWKAGDAQNAAMKDPFFQQLRNWYNWQCDIPDLHGCSQRQRSVMLTLLMLLVNRAVRLQEYCCAHKEFLFASPACLPRLYTDVILFKGVYIGLKDSSGSKSTRNVATTEQKLWGIGHLIDVLCVPSWEDPQLLDRLVAAPDLDSFVDALEAHKKFDGDLVFTHSLEYIYLLHQDRLESGKPSLFNFTLDAACLDSHVRPGSNSQIFLNYINATAKGQRLIPFELCDLADLVDSLLPSHIVTEDDVRVDMLPFAAKDASQTACKMVEVFQSQLSNRTGGKERDPDNAPKSRPLQARPVTLELIEWPCVPQSSKRQRAAAGDEQD